MTNKSTKKLSALMRARFPYIYISSYEENRVIEILCDIAENQEMIKTTREVLIWTQTEGFVDKDNRTLKGDLTNPIQAIKFVKEYRGDAIFIFKDFHVYFGVNNRPPETSVIRKLRDTTVTLTMGEYKKNVFFVSPCLVIPDDMQKEISVFDFPLPGVEEIRDTLNRMLSENESLGISLTEEDKEKLAKGALGLTLQEAENAFARAMVESGHLTADDIQIIFDEKNQVIKKTGILEFVSSDINIDDIGGLENLKRWLQKRNNSWLDSAKKYCIPAPKGVLVTGVPGCGKSLTAKAMSAIWQLPLLKLDMGKIFSGIVGSSEENMRRAIQTAEAVAPSILWIDEIEKGFGGVGSGGDSGTSTRIFGTFLSWMQDKTAPVFVMATANNISGLPPELLRKGRFDEIFFVDMPTRRERKEIFRVHLMKRLRNPEVSGEVSGGTEISETLLEQLAEKSEGFVGAEIEQAVIAALYEAFFENRSLTIKDLETVIENTVPLSVTQKEQIKSLREWANVRAVAATSKEDLAQYKEVMDTDNVSTSRGGRTIDF